MPDSGTSQWYIDTGGNSAMLNPGQGAVFGYVIFAELHSISGRADDD